jgi:hypothetical protein
MTFHELFEKYKKGEATPDEKRIVEEEIEKNKLINDHIIGELASDPVKPGGPDERTKPDKQSMKTVRRIMRRTLLKTAAIAAVLVLAGFLIADHVVSPLVASRYYNPAKVIIDEESSGLPYPITQGALDEMVSSELTYYFALMTSYIVDDLGYGKYHIQRGRYDLFDQEYDFYDVTVTRGDENKDYWTNSGTYAFTYHSDYNSPGRTYFNGTEELSELPDTAVVEAAVLFSEEHTIPELVDIMETNPDLFFEWVAVTNTYSYRVRKSGDNFYIGLLGFRPVYIHGFNIPSHIDIGYPYLSLPDHEEITAEILEQHFISLLTYYCDHKEYNAYVYLSAPAYGEDTMIWHENTLEKIKETGVKTYGAVVIGSPQDIISLYDSGVINGIEIYDVKSSVYENDMF